MLSAAGQHLEGSIALLRARQVIVPLAPLSRSVIEVACRTAVRFGQAGAPPNPISLPSGSRKVALRTPLA